jgi:molybdopterin molybdotransferase
MSKEKQIFNDVRMRGFAQRALVRSVLEWVDANSHPLNAMTVPLAESHDRILANDVVAKIAVPPFDRSAMDGYALKGSETVGAGDYNPLPFRLVGESMPGRAFSGEVAAGTAVRIMTGAPLPNGADAVVPAEFASETESHIEITTTVSPKKHVGFVGEDVKQGTQVLDAGRRVRPQDVALMASVGVSEIDVVRRPRVRLLITGNELVTPGQPRDNDQIFEANSFMLRGLVERDGGTLDSIVFAEDTRDAIRSALTAPGADVVIVSGGSSVGCEDFAPTIVAEEGELAIHGIAMRPSSPTGLGCVGETLVFLLPGNPVSCLCAYDFFAARSIRRLGGRGHTWPYVSKKAILAEKIVSAIGRFDYCRVQLKDGRVQPLAISGASILSSTTRADGFVVISTDSEGYAAGETVEVFLYDGSASPLLASSL